MTNSVNTENRVLEVSDVTARVGALIGSDAQLQSLTVQGELSNFRKQSVGHLYFTLKDSQSQLRCAMFRSAAAKLRFLPQDGMKLICFGRIDVYARDGAYQLIVSDITPMGAGDLNAEYERLKASLTAQGLFDEAHKKQLPRAPGRIAVVTSPTGAAIRDIIRILGARWPLSKVLVMPVRVQGEEAPKEIANAIKYANIRRVADLIITGRGGGSIEDLWAFNTEIVANAIYNSTIPIISAVGHEPDRTIADYVADVRASTPSNAAELAVPDINDVRANLSAAAIRVNRSVERTLLSLRQWLDSVSSRRVIRSPGGYFKERRTALSRQSERLESSFEKKLDKTSGRLSSLSASLGALSPVAALNRGYAILRDDAGDIIRSVGAVKTSDYLTVSLSDGKLITQIKEIIP